MKRTILLVQSLITLLGAGHIALAQRDYEPEYLFDMKKVKLTVFGNTSDEFSFVDGVNAYSIGSSGAFLFNYQYFIGMYNLDVQSDIMRDNIYPNGHHPVTNPLDPQYVYNSISFHHGGLWLGYIHKPNKLLHWGADLKVGMGIIALYDRDLEMSVFNEHHKDWISVIQPEVNIEFNFTRWFRIGMGLGYRQVFGVDNTEYTNDQGHSVRLFEPGQFSSPTGTIKFLFGGFAPRPHGKNNRFGENGFD
ncbi:MAG TPA: hypothetical protein PKL52_09270 [Tenuifilaceae bacterium]|jgi:hypothetical protein|nr:hypothetical protein [Tenuifilaceae bacterium]